VKSATEHQSDDPSSLCGRHFGRVILFV